MHVCINSVYCLLDRVKGKYRHCLLYTSVDCMPNMMYADLAVRFHYRELAIRALADSGLKIHTYGAGYKMCIRDRF